MFHRSNFYYNETERKYARTEQLRVLIRDKAHDRPRFGYRRITVLLRREGYKVSKNTVYRIYKQECLGLKKSSKKFAKRLSRARVAPSPASRPNQRWSIDFIYDHLTNGTRFRSLSVIDQYSRKCLAFIPKIRFLSQDVIESLEMVAQQLGQYPESITSDNGAEFTCIVYDEWAKKCGIQVDLIQPGKPNQNGFVESFHGKIRDECLSINRFQTLKMAETEIGLWIKDYNNVRPHSSLKDEVPDKIWKEFQRDLDFSLQTG